MTTLTAHIAYLALLAVCGWLWWRDLTPDREASKPPVRVVTIDLSELDADLTDRFIARWFARIDNPNREG